MPSGTLVFLDSAGSSRREQLALAALRPFAALARRMGAPTFAYRVLVESALPLSERDIVPADVLGPDEVDAARRAAFEAAMRAVRSGGVASLPDPVEGALHAGVLAYRFADVAEAALFANRAARRAEAARVLVVSTSGWRGRYIARTLRREGIPAFALAIPDTVPMIGDGAQRALELVRYEVSEELPADESPDVLLVAESPAIHGSLLPVAQRLREDAGRRVALVRGTYLPAGRGTRRSRSAPRGARRRPASAEAAVLDAIGRDLSVRQGAKADLTRPDVEALLERFRPRLLAVGNDRIWSGQLLVQAARRRDIPVLCVQDGLAVDTPSWWFWAADYTATNGPFLRELLIRLGAPRDTVFVTGQPRMDAMHDRLTRLSTTEARASLGLDGTRRYALLALQGVHGREYIREALAGLTRVDGLRVLVRPHPRQDRQMLDAALAEARRGGATVELRAGDDIGTLLRAVDVVVSQYSTVLVEAALMGTPSVSLTLSGGLNPLDLAREALALEARSAPELGSAVARALELDARALEAARVRAEVLLGPFDGRAAERVADLVEALLLRHATDVPLREGPYRGLPGGVRQPVSGAGEGAAHRAVLNSSGRSTPAQPAPGSP